MRVAVRAYPQCAKRESQTFIQKLGSLKAAIEEYWAKLIKDMEAKEAKKTRDEQVAKLKDFVTKCGPLMKHKITNVSKIVKENKNDPLRWVQGTHWGYGMTSNHGRSPQGGGIPPIVVRKSSLERYHRHIVQHGV